MAQSGRKRETQEIIERIVSGIGTDYKNNPVRRAYEKEVNNLARLKARLLKEGQPPKKIAKTLWRERRNLGVKYKDLTPWPLRQYIYNRNENSYGDRLGPSFESLEAKYSGDYDEIVNSALRYNTNIDGVLAPFRKWLAERPRDFLERAARDFSE